MLAESLEQACMTWIVYTYHDLEINRFLLDRRGGHVEMPLVRNLECTPRRDRLKT